LAAEAGTNSGPLLRSGNPDDPIERLIDDLSTALATAGAGIGDDSDFARATQAATDLELRFGFGAIGVAHFSDRATEMLLHDPSIVALITKRLERCLTRARELVAANREAVEAVAKRLEETGYLDRTAIDNLLRRIPSETSPEAVERSNDQSNGGDLSWRPRGSAAYDRSHARRQHFQSRKAERLPGRVHGRSQSPRRNESAGRHCVHARPRPTTKRVVIDRSGYRRGERRGVRPELGISMSRHAPSGSFCKAMHLTGDEAREIFDAAGTPERICFETRRRAHGTRRYA
jgi:hypothetical protein